MMQLDDFNLKKTEVDIEKIKKYDSENDFMFLSVELLKETGVITGIISCTYRNDEKNNPRKWKRNEAILGGLMVRLCKLQMGFLDQICQKRLETAMIIFRCLGETIINIIYLLEKNNEKLFNKFIEYSLREEKRLLNKININIKKRGYGLPIERRMKISIERSFQTSGFVPEQVDENNYKSWEETIYKRAKHIGMEELYISIFGLPSHYIHGNWQDLISNHLEYDNKEFSPNMDWTRPRPQPLLAVCKLSCKVNNLFSEKIMPKCPDKEKVKQILDDINQRTVAVDELHEKFLQKNKNMNSKKCIIIHGCPSDSNDPTYSKHWMAWTKKQLIANGIETETPLMPTPWQPDYEKFKMEFEKYSVDENTILVGHSCGCAFLVRWLGETKKKIYKLVLVAPWKIPDEGDTAREKFYNYKIDETIKDRVNNIVMFTSDNEEVDGKKSLNLFHEALGGEVVELKGRGHYTIDDMKTEEFPELLKTILQ